MSARISAGLFNSSGPITNPVINSNVTNIVDTSAYNTIISSLNNIQEGIYSKGGVKVLVNGFPESPVIWQNLIPQLTAAGFTNIVTLGLPGVGEPVPPGFVFTRDNFSNWLYEQLEVYVNAGTPIDIVGHDIGALTIVDLAIARPTLFRSISYDVAGINTVLPFPPYGPFPYGTFGLGQFQTNFAVPGTDPAYAQGLITGFFSQSESALYPYFDAFGMDSATFSQMYADSIQGNSSVLGQVLVPFFFDTSSSPISTLLYAQGLGAAGVKNILLITPDNDNNPDGFIGDSSSYYGDISGNVRNVFVDLSGQLTIQYGPDGGLRAYYFYTPLTTNTVGVNTGNYGTIGSLFAADIINGAGVTTGANANVAMLAGLNHYWMLDNPTLTSMILSNRWKQFA